MKCISKVLVIAIIILISGRISPAQTDSDNTPHAPTVSIITLLAESAKKIPYRVQVSGFLMLEFEGNALYLHREDYQEGLARNAIRLSLTPEQQKNYKDLAGGYVVVEASFQKRSDSEDTFTGSLFNVRQIRKTLSRVDGR